MLSSLKAPKTVEIQGRIVRVITFLLVFFSMTLALSFMPIWPLEPLYMLPVIVSFLIAFLAFKNPKLGITIGSFLIGVSLIYHLSEINFISGIAESTGFRFLAVLVILCFFLFVPYSIEKHEDAVAIAMGVMAATLLFFDEAYYLAIPLILIFAVLYKKAKLTLTLSYYFMISVPIQIMDFLKEYMGGPSSNVLPILYGPIAVRFKPIEPFNLNGINDAVLKILGNITGECDKNVLQAVNAYMNSLPGIATFLIMVFGLISASAFATFTFLKMLKGITLTRKYAKYIEIFLPTITAVIVAQIFWILSISFRGATLLIDVKIDGTTMTMGTLAIIGVTLPVSVIDYMLKMQIMIEKRSKTLLEKAQNLILSLQKFKEKLNNLKSSIPISLSSIEGKVLLTEDKLKDVVAKASSKIYDLQTIDEKFRELETAEGQIKNLSSELDVSLEEYYTSAVYEYLEWTERLKDLEIETEKTVEVVDIDSFRGLSFEAKVEAIKTVLSGGRRLAEEVTRVFNDIYNLIRLLYDPKLPAKSSTEEFVKQSLGEEATPWIALDALLTTLQNLEKQYGSEIAKSIRNLQNSLSNMVKLSAQSEKLQPILGDAVPKLMELAKEGEEIIKNTTKKKRNIMKITLVKEALQSTLKISTEILQTLYKELIKKEEMILRLLLTKDYEWGKNTSIMEKLETTIDVLSNPSKYNLDEVIGSLYKSLDYIEECIETISAYNKKYEFILNYPIAETVIENIFGHNDQVRATDLPFKLEYAREYLKLYSRQKYVEVSFNESNDTLEKRV